MFLSNYITSCFQKGIVPFYLTPNDRDETYQDVITWRCSVHWSWMGGEDRCSLQLVVIKGGIICHTYVLLRSSQVGLKSIWCSQPDTLPITHTCMHRRIILANFNSHFSCVIQVCTLFCRCYHHCKLISSMATYGKCKASAVTITDQILWHAGSWSSLIYSAYTVAKR